MSRKSWIVLTTVLLFGGALYAFDLVKDTQTASIVLPENPHPSSRLAAEELSEYVCKVTGKKLAVAIGQSDATNKVYIGTFDTLNEIPESAAKALKAAKQDEAHFICAKGDNLYIIGKQEVAELYATYQFIEDKLGVRWLKVPDEIDNGEYVPKSASIVFDDYERFREPAFAVHRIDRGHSSEAVTFKGKTWANRNGYQTPRSYERSIPYDKPDSPQCSFFVPRVPRSKNSIGGSHTTFVSPMPAKTTFDEHPEYFALIDCKRVKGNQYCISNPEVRRNVADFIIRGLDKGNGLGMYNFGMWDTGIGWCEKAKNGYRRTHHKELAKGGEYQLTDTQQIFSGEYTIAPNEWIGLELIAADALIDDVSVLLVK